MTASPWESFTTNTPVPPKASESSPNAPGVMTACNLAWVVAGTGLSCKSMATLPTLLSIRAVPSPPSAMDSVAYDSGLAVWDMLR